MVKATLYHASNTRDSFFYRRNGNIYNRTNAYMAFRRNGYDEVAMFEVESDCDACLEQIYAQSQNIDSPWRRDNPTRSTSVGDIVKIGDAVFIVASCGFEVLWGTRKDNGLTEQEMMDMRLELCDINDAINDIEDHTFVTEKEVSKLKELKAKREAILARFNKSR